MQIDSAKEVKAKAGSSLSSSDISGRILPKKTTFEAIEESLKLVTPSWPLQNTVAVNPFWFLRDRSFNNVAEGLTSVIHSSLFMPIEYYLEKIRAGQIDQKSLADALQDFRARGYMLPLSLEEFSQVAEASSGEFVNHMTFAEKMAEGRQWHRLVKEEVGKFAAGYLDEGQAISPFPWRDETFWNAWIKAMQNDRSMQVAGVKSFQDSVTSLANKSAKDAIKEMLQQMGITSPDIQVIYTQRLVATVMGWMTQFKYAEWQRGLGHTNDTKTAAVDLLAVRMAYDYALFKFSENRNPSSIIEWRLQLTSSGELFKGRQSFVIQQVLQAAAELSYQRRLADQISIPRTELKVKPKVQMAFCIDVRSEMLRRHIENADKSIQTIGFAGFFGLPFDYKRVGEKNAGHRLPVLLKPEFVVKENHRHIQGGLESGTIASYFRNLRKNSLSSFLYVELFGPLYIFKMVQRTWESLVQALRIGQETPARFSSKDSGPNQEDVMGLDGRAYDYEKKTGRAATILRHMGLTDNFAELVVLVGHGSQTTNNAFGSSLDCGACGGHAGDINARFLAGLLNDAKVRKGLEDQGIIIPASTVFLAAVHETVSDEVYLLDKENIPKDKHSEVQKMEECLQRSSRNTRYERNNYLSGALEPRSFVRSRNWSEVRPEWGLAGNACFIVAPRGRTLGLNLASRSFLHDYEWKKDQLNGFKTLELIMTAPMIVTNWINLQYYSSTVAPQVYGSGSKILHNVTNEFGVVEGNGGDLRVGLPIQSVHDGNKFVHEPLRLSVFIEAPIEQIEKVIAQHQVVRELVENEWLHLLHIDAASLRVTKRQSGGRYLPL